MYKYLEMMYPTCVGRCVQVIQEDNSYLQCTSAAGVIEPFERNAQQQL